MGRTNLTLLGMGILACVVLALLMQRGLKVQKDGRSHAVARAVDDVYGSRLRHQPEFRIDIRDDRRVGILILTPNRPGSTLRIAQDIGRFVWQEEPSKFDSLEILCKKHKNDPGIPITIPKPYLAEPPASRSGQKKPAQARPAPGKPPGGTHAPAKSPR